MGIVKIQKEVTPLGRLPLYSLIKYYFLKAFYKFRSKPREIIFCYNAPIRGYFD